MRNIKETVIGVFAVIGFLAIASGFTTNNEAQEPTYGTPESHVWEMHTTSHNTGSFVFSINKVTGEVRKYNSYYAGIEKAGEKHFDVYRVARQK